MSVRCHEGCHTHLLDDPSVGSFNLLDFAGRLLTISMELRLNLPLRWSSFLYFKVQSKQSALLFTFRLASRPLSKYAVFLQPSQRFGFPYFSSADLHLETEITDIRPKSKHQNFFQTSCFSEHSTYYI